MKRNALFASVLLLSTTSLLAATATGSAQARIGAPLIITAGDTLSFGTIFVTDQTSGGSVTVGWDSTNQVLTTSGTGATPLTSTDVNDTAWVLAADDPALGTFTVQGPPTAELTYAVSVGTGVLSFQGTTCPDGYDCADMTLTPTVVDPSTATGSGQTVFKVGGTLTMGGTQGEGSYAGTYTITADYQ
jgi:hypothetical protein